MFAMLCYALLCIVGLLLFVKCCLTCRCCYVLECDVMHVFNMIVLGCVRCSDGIAMCCCVLSVRCVACIVLMRRGVLCIACMMPMLMCVVIV